MPNISSRMFQKLKDREYRNSFLTAQIRHLIPRQLRAIRESQQLTQHQLADAAGTTQTVISRIEKGGGGNLTIKSLLNLAKALDVALVVRFEPIDHLMSWTEDLSFCDIAPERSQVIFEKLEKAVSERSGDIATFRLGIGGGTAPGAALDTGSNESLAVDNVVDIRSMNRGIGGRNSNEMKLPDAMAI